MIGAIKGIRNDLLFNLLIKKMRKKAKGEKMYEDLQEIAIFILNLVIVRDEISCNVKVK